MKNDNESAPVNNNILEFDFSKANDLYNVLRKHCPSVPSYVGNGAILCKLPKYHNDYIEHFEIRVINVVDGDKDYSVTIREIHDGDDFVDHTFYFNEVSEVVEDVANTINRFPLSNKTDHFTVLNDWSDFNAVMPYTVIIDSNYTVWRKHYFNVWQSTDWGTRTDQEMADNTTRATVLFENHF